MNITIPFPCRVRARYITKCLGTAGGSPAQGVDLSGQVANSARFPKQEPVPVLAASSLALGAADHKILCSVRGMLQEALLLGPSLADLNKYLSRAATWMPFRVIAE